MQSVMERIGALNKGLGSPDRSFSAEEVAQQGWNLLREDLTLPAAVLYQDRLQHNLNWMREFIAAYGVRLAPHGKTTMAPRLFAMQLESGAWGITLATAQQTLVAHAHGVRRVLMANQLIGKENMAVIARLLEDSAFDYYCLVDSAEQVEQLGKYFSARGQRLQVLLELGAEGGRAGVRNDEQLQSALESLGRWENAIALCGIEVYEGVLSDEGAIRSYLRHALEVTRQLAREKRFARTPPLLSGAGSAWYDVVAEEFSSTAKNGDVEVVLRPGCYLTHDVGAYRVAQERILRSNPVARKMHEGLLPALQVWAYVQSIPDADKAIIGMGKRDAAFDSGLPVPALHFRPGDAEPRKAAAQWTLTKMMDQHAYLRVGAGDDLRVGDMIGFDICHPCLTFDKWRTLVVVDSRYTVVDVVSTYF
ncbi:MAG TPA: amino acid deaminase [Acidobacteriaceae bacterium]|nr:amino acid deaminase [Acidobacteriaceae bacterium]